MLKKQNGITLVALIITIIVMLILAGVSISLVLGNNGVLTQANNASKSNIKGALTDAISMANADIIADFYSNSTGKAKAKLVTADNIKTYINNNFSYKTDTDEATVTLSGTTAGTVTFTKGADTVTLNFDINTDKEYMNFQNITE